MVLDHVFDLAVAGLFEVNPHYVVGLRSVLNPRHHYNLDNAAAIFLDRIQRKEHGWLDQLSSRQLPFDEPRKCLSVALTWAQECARTVPLAWVGCIIVGAALEQNLDWPLAVNHHQLDAAADCLLRHCIKQLGAHSAVRQAVEQGCCYLATTWCAKPQQFLDSVLQLQ